MKLKQILFLFFISLMFVSCEGDISVGYKFGGLDVYHLDNTGSIPQKSTADSLPGIAYGLRLDFHSVETYRGRGRYVDYNDDPPSNENSMRAIYITSNEPFDASHPAGSLLNDKFYYFPGNYANSEALLDSTPFVLNVQSMREFPEMEFVEYADLLLINPPNYLGQRSFTVRIVLQDSTEMIANTSLIKLY
jgi:hypothetical protein